MHIRLIVIQKGHRLSVFRKKNITAIFRFDSISEQGSDQQKDYHISNNGKDLSISVSYHIPVRAMTIWTSTSATTATTLKCW